MWNKRRTVGGRHRHSLDGRPTPVLPACRGTEQVRPSNVIVSRNSNVVVRSYLTELRNIAINFRSLGPVTSARLKNAEILVGSRRFRTREYDEAIDDTLDDEEDPDLEYTLLLPNHVAIVDDMIAYQQFGGDIFCAPQENILEGEYGSTWPWHSISTLETVDFYRSLGCEQLSDLIHEKLQGTKEIRGNNTVREVRSLILQRLPLFLGHRHTAAKTISWLKDERNFVIRTFKKVTVKRSINFAGVKSSISIETPAAAKREGRGTIELWLIDNKQVEMYEVATSLYRVLFETRDANQTLLLATILSSDLHTLRRRGYPGDYEAPPFPGPANWVPGS